MRKVHALSLTLALVALPGCWGSPSGKTKGADVGPTAGAPGSWGTSEGAALEAAGTRDIAVLADFTGSDWCPWCVKLREEVFETPEFKEWARTRVALLEVDFPKHAIAPELAQQNNRLQEKYGVEGLPTVLFLDGHGQKIGELGYVRGGPGVWLKKAQAILDARVR